MCGSLSDNRAAEESVTADVDISSLLRRNGGNPVGEAVLGQNVIGVDKCDVVAGGSADPGIPCRTDPSVRLMYHTYTFIYKAESVTYFPRTVSASVVYQDELAAVKK